MAKTLTPVIMNQILDKSIKPIFRLYVNSVDVSSYLMNFNFNFDTSFGSASFTCILNNDSGIFSGDGQLAVEVGQEVSFIEKYAEDSLEFKKFYGFVNQRSLNISSVNRSISLVCLDYISALKFYDIDLTVEGTKVEIENETLTPNFLPAPNETLAQVFDFNNSGIATNPTPIIMIKDRLHNVFDPQYDGFEIFYQHGQLKLGSPLNAQDNYDIIAKKYSFYTEGAHIEDILEAIITEPNGYDEYLFGEKTKEDLINNHLKESFNNLTEDSVDYLTPNYTSTEIVIRHKLTEACEVGNSYIILNSVEGLPDSGQAEISGNLVSWTSIESGNKLVGIPTTGIYSLKDHPEGSVFKYTETFSPGQVWYLTYNNIISDFSYENFDVGSGNSVRYFDKRMGRIILENPILLTSVVFWNGDYEFKTLQATGVELNSISFRPRELENRYEAIEKLRNYLAPNYIIRTIGDDKIWANYLRQNVRENYELELLSNLNYLESEDLYTRTVFYAKNRNPLNITFNEGIDFYSTGETYKGMASNTVLKYIGEEGNNYVYGTVISGVGYIDATDYLPLLYVNDIPIDNSVHRINNMPVMQDIKTRTTTKTGCHGISSESYTKIHTYYYYSLRLPHANILSTHPVTFYDSFGNPVITVSPSDANMDWSRGVYLVPGDQKNEEIESISTATYHVFYSTGSVVIDYDEVLFKINKNLIFNPLEAVITSTFEYWTVMIPIHDIAAVIDGRWDTQVQIEFYAQPPSNYPLTIIDLGQEYHIQAMDIVGGFFRPDDYRKFDISFNFSLQYSLDGVSFYEISDETHNVSMTGGESVSFEEDALGTDFTARFIRVNLENVSPINYGSRDGLWVVAFSEIALYGDVILKSECKLIPTTVSVGSVDSESTELILEDSYGFNEPESGEVVEAYIAGEPFTYTGIESGNKLTGCEFESGSSYLFGSFVTTSLQDDNSIYDLKGLLPKLGDRLYKNADIDPQIMYTEEELNYVSKAFLKEFVKNHTKIQAQVMYSPFLEVGQTVKVVDTFNNIDRNYFIESISDNNGYYMLTLAYYPNE